MNSYQLTPKQSKFCEVYLETGNATEAYRRAYNTITMQPNTIHRAAKELHDLPKIRSYIDTLRSAVEKEIVTKLANEDVYDRIAAARDVDNAYAIAQGKNNPAAMIAAVQLKAKLYNLIIDRAEVKTSALDELSDEDSLAVINALNAINKARQLP